MIGAVKDLVMNAHSVTPALVLCGKATLEYARECYGALGMMHRSIEGRPGVRLSRCADVREEFRNYCAAAPRT